MKRKVFFLSDSTGMTAENLGRSLLVQFPQIQFESVTKPFVDTPEKAQRIAAEINKEAHETAARPIVIDTIIDQEVSKVIEKSSCFYIDVFSTFLSPLEAELGVRSAHNVGHPAIFKEDSRTVDQAYMQRIDAVHFALANDDGMHLHRYAEADIILIGVSRTGKTPTSVYLGMQYGIKAANYPLIPDDLETRKLPAALADHQRKLFGLTIRAGRLSEIRHERKPNSHYANLRTCVDEIRQAETLYRQYRVPYIDTTQLSIEEIAARMLQRAGIERRVASL
ncbi:putative phosphoenolpyruvate synthase regulatory protein [Arenicella chitinivorans]|uniref:Putative phosphoenolpyruvate synthase regulatory protein n=1 Tax=Arenicella chitinivorans TaxID=1329800 RepID=A0A918VK00_9GAMM|nr:pyruvate, water dikinase regulatory protein [Arenicella chitinivorans]GHA02306.1 putative phosphoenolpyruvate synthase regulatory protein [Arenicella chitinivorans]